MKSLLFLTLFFLTGCNTGLYQLAQGDCALPEIERPVACSTVSDNWDGFIYTILGLPGDLL